MSPQSDRRWLRLCHPHGRNQPPARACRLNATYPHLGRQPGSNHTPEVTRTLEAVTPGWHETWKVTRSPGTYSQPWDVHRDGDRTIIDGSDTGAALAAIRVRLSQPATAEDR